MAYLVRRIHGREYVYHAFRSGEKVIQKYVGPLEDREAKEKLGSYRDRNRIPGFVRPLFWDVDPDALNLRKHSRYIVERILELGDLQALAWIQRKYPTELLEEVATGSRRMSPKSKNFWAIWFGKHAQT